MDRHADVPKKIYNIWGNVDWKKSYQALLDYCLSLIALNRVNASGKFMRIAEQERDNYQQSSWEWAKSERGYMRQIGSLEGQLKAEREQHDREIAALKEQHDREIAALEAQLDEFLNPSSYAQRSSKDPSTQRYIGLGGITKPEKEAMAWEIWQTMGAAKNESTYNYISHRVGLTAQSTRQYIAEYDKKLKAKMLPGIYSNLVEAVRAGEKGLVKPDVKDINLSSLTGAHWREANLKNWNEQEEFRENPEVIGA